MIGHPQILFVFFCGNFLLLVCELFRAHEMRSQLECLSVKRNTLLLRMLWSACMEMGLQSILLIVRQLNPAGVWVLGFLITMPRKEARWW